MVILLIVYKQHLVYCGYFVSIFSSKVSAYSGFYVLDAYVN